MKKQICLIAMLAWAATARGQEYTLKGGLIFNNANFYYKLVFTDSAGYIKGYSSYILRDATEHRTAITGIIDSGRLSFIETSVSCSRDQGQIHYRASAYGAIVKKGKKVYYDAVAEPVLKGYANGSHDMDHGRLVLYADSVTAQHLLASMQTAQKNPAVTRQLETVSSDTALRLPEWSGNTLLISVYDDKEEDGDRLTLSLNGKVLLKDLTLTESGEALETELNQGLNVLTIHAENNGTLPPNTSRMVLVGNEYRYTFQTLLNAGKDAQIELNVEQ